MNLAPLYNSAIYQVMYGVDREIIWLQLTFVYLFVICSILDMLSFTFTYHVILSMLSSFCSANEEGKKDTLARFPLPTSVDPHEEQKKKARALRCVRYPYVSGLKVAKCGPGKVMG